MKKNYDTEYILSKHNLVPYYISEQVPNNGTYQNIKKENKILNLSNVFRLHSFCNKNLINEMKSF